MLPGRDAPQSPPVGGLRAVREAGHIEDEDRLPARVEREAREPADVLEQRAEGLEEGVLLAVFCILDANSIN